MLEFPLWKIGFLSYASPVSLSDLWCQGESRLVAAFWGRWVMVSEKIPKGRLGGGMG